ncbi:TasA family protein [Mesobacillus jeotgali]|uniref:TasA family protein n=1 Tax=Mesobacillus jeotgali TaxID=129985 RepID=UPI000C835234|nr:TasA family protein [Mesobacillus jeotgali]
MSLKKKLTLGAMSSALGLSLVAGGTWAAFNDIETVNGSVANGNLKLELNAVDGGPTNFTVSDLKPGDSMTRQFELKNVGSLAIKDVLLSIDSINFNDYGYDSNGNRDTSEVAADADSDIFGKNTDLEYLEQFQITLARTGIEGAEEEIINSGDDITLADVYKATNQGDTTAINKLDAALGNHWEDNRINLVSTATNKWQGLPADPRDWDTVELTIEFVEYGTAALGDVENQNKYQGDKVDVNFTLEARQWDGQDVSDEEGVIESNSKAKNGAYGN